MHRRNPTVWVPKSVVAPLEVVRNATFKTLSRLRAPFLLGALTSLLLLGCDSDSAGLSGVDPFGEEGITANAPLTLGDFENVIAESPRRVELTIASTEAPLVAAAVEVEGVEALSDPEEIKSAVQAVGATDIDGTLTIELGELQITFDQNTTFYSSAGESVSLTAFVVEVEEWLTTETPPTVKALRTAPTEPQAPDDPTFHATELRLDLSIENAALEVNIDADNLVSEDPSTGNAMLTVLGLTIEIRDSVTEIEEDTGEPDEEVEKAAHHKMYNSDIVSVDLAERTFTLRKGPIVKITESTELYAKSHLATLEEVEAIVAAGGRVKAKGRAKVTDEGPPVLAEALSVGYKHKTTGTSDDSNGNGAEFEDAVASVDEIAGSFTLMDGRVVIVTSDTQVDAKGDLTTLEQVAAVLADGGSVKAEGEGNVTDEGPPEQINATSVEFETRESDDDDDGKVEFESAIATIDLDAQTLTLEDGTVVQVTGATELKVNGKHAISSLADAASEVAEGQTVVATGNGLLLDEGPPVQLEAIKLKLQLLKGDDDGDDDEEEGHEYEGTVASVDVATRTFILDDGTVVTWTETAVVGDKSDLLTIEELDAAITAGNRVKAKGRAEVLDDGPPAQLEALTIEFDVKKPTGNPNS